MTKNEIHKTLDRAKKRLNSPITESTAIEVAGKLVAAGQGILALPDTDPDKASLKFEATVLIKQLQVQYP